LPFCPFDTPHDLCGVRNEVVEFETTALEKADSESANQNHPLEQQNNGKADHWLNNNSV